ncbi:MAG: NADAR family protein [Sphingobacteriales bacterium]|nr:MAG: NADAR family protein [Sphingobacteriales bacterium]
MQTKYNIEGLKKLINEGLQPRYLFFWGHTAPAGEETGKFVFSQWYPSSFTVNGTTYKTAEHWMMAQKALLFDDLDAFQKIIAAPKPAAAKALGRSVHNYEDTRWNEVKFEIVVQGNIHKFVQNKALSAYLMGTGDRVIVEASPVDPVWGIGLAQDSPGALHPDNWKGENLLGFALMEAREFLRNGKDPGTLNLSLNRNK